MAMQTEFTARIKVPLTRIIGSGGMDGFDNLIEDKLHAQRIGVDLAICNMDFHPTGVEGECVIIEVTGYTEPWD